MNDPKIDAYLAEMGVAYQNLGENVWLVEDEPRGLPGVFVMRTDPLVVIRVSVMKKPAQRQFELFQKLLELNARDLLHGAYALDGDEIVLMDTLQYETMDPGDFEASLEAIGLALSQHFPILSMFLERRPD